MFFFISIDLICCLIFLSLNCAVLNVSGELSPIVGSRSPAESENQQQRGPPIEHHTKILNTAKKEQLQSIKEENSGTFADQKSNENDNSTSLLHTQQLSKIPPTIEAEKLKPTLSIFSKISQSSHTKTAPVKPKSPTSINPYNRSTPSALSTLSSIGGRKFSPFEERLNELASDGQSKTTTSSSLASSGTDNAINSTSNDIVRNVESTTKTMGHIDIYDDTPLKMFQVPTTKRVLSTHRPMGTCGRRRPALESEFRSQRILFTTPTAVSRPTIALMSHVGLDDSLNCYKSPSTTILHDIDEQHRSILRPVENNVKVESKPIDINVVQPEPIEEIVTKTTDKENVMEVPGPCIKNIGSEDAKKLIKINGKDFILKKKIGQGGSSRVYLASHKESGQDCALKVNHSKFRLFACTNF